MNDPYRNDLEAAHARIASLERQLAGKQEQEEEEVRVTCPECGGWFRGIAKTAFFSFLGLVIGLGIVVGFTLSTRSCGDLGSCYIRNDGDSQQGYLLMRTVDGKNDMEVGEYGTIEAAVKDAKTIGCELK